MHKFSTRMNVCNDGDVAFGAGDKTSTTELYNRGTFKGYGSDPLGNDRTMTRDIPRMIQFGTGAQNLRQR